MEKKQELETLGAINIALLLLFFYSGRKYFVSASLITTLVCLLLPFVLTQLHLAWSRFFLLLGSINAKILLAIVYFFLLVPVALFSRLFKKKQGTIAADNYKTRNYLFTAKDFERPG